MKAALITAVMIATGLFAAPPAVAHFGSTAYIIVTEDSVLPGQDFEVVASDLTPNSTVSFRVVREELGLTVPLETTTAPADGHFRLSMAVPADFPEGYAQLFATAGDRTEVSTWVLVGTRTAATPPRPGTGPWWSDPSVIVLGVIIAGVVAAAGWMLIRRRSAPLSPVRSARTMTSIKPRRRPKG